MSQSIHFKQVTKRYSDQLAVDQVDFTIEAGEIYGLLGPNGAGKTTLISMLCGLTSIDKGEIFTGDHAISKYPEAVKANIGYVPQELALFESLTVYENLNFFAGLYGLRGSLKKSRILEALEAVGLEESAKKKVRTLSGGMKRRLNIGCALLHHPKILIMDEPTVGIDPQSRNHILEFTRRMNQERGTTILYTSHYMEEVQSLCTRIMILDKGRMVIEGDKASLLRSVVNETTLTIQTLNPDTIACHKGIEALKRHSGVRQVVQEGPQNQTLHVTVQSGQYNIGDLVTTLQHHGFAVNSLSIQEPTLETVFLSLTGKQLRDE